MAKSPVDQDSRSHAPNDQDRRDVPAKDLQRDANRAAEERPVPSQAEGEDFQVKASGSVQWLARMDSRNTDLLERLSAGDEKARLKAALEAGSDPDPGMVEVLVERCAVEPNFFVRDMLTWALTRLPAEATVPRVVAELRSKTAQARSQALHTLSKIKDARAWPAITRELLRDTDDEVARTAWRAAVILVPDGQGVGLAEELATQFGRGDRETQLSLSRALVALGEEVAGPVVQQAVASDDPKVRTHAAATGRLFTDPKAGSELAVNAARRIYALKDAPVPKNN